MPRAINRNRLIRSGLTLTTLTYVSHPRLRSASPNAIRVRPIDMLYASRIRIRQIFRVCESTRRALPVGDRRETFRGENAQGMAAISVETRFSLRRLETKYLAILFARTDSYYIENIRRFRGKRTKMFRKCKIFQL